MGIRQGSRPAKALLALAAVATLAACGNGTGQAGRRSSTTTRATSASTSTAPISATSTTSTAPGATSPSSTVSTPGLPGVIADCTAPGPQGQQSQVEPTSITVACADNGIGVQNATWTSWTSSGATGVGKVWENSCTPDCVTGTVGTYPASIALSGVEPTSVGDLFSQMSVTYQGAGPDGHTTDRFDLPLPPQ